MVWVHRGLKMSLPPLLLQFVALQLPDKWMNVHARRLGVRTRAYLLRRRPCQLAWALVQAHPVPLMPTLLRSPRVVHRMSPKVLKLLNVGHLVSALSIFSCVAVIRCTRTRVLIAIRVCVHSLVEEHVEIFFFFLAEEAQDCVRVAHSSLSAMASDCVRNSYFAAFSFTIRHY